MHHVNEESDKYLRRRAACVQGSTNKVVRMNRGKSAVHYCDRQDDTGRPGDPTIAAGDAFLLQHTEVE
jgi:hypothetical protein